VGGTPLTGLTITTAQLTAGAIALATTGTPALSITNSSTGSITGIISGTNATLTKAGAGTLTLSGANTYGGATTVNNGVLSISSDTNLGSMPGSVVIASVVLDGGALQATENLTLHSNRGVLLGAAGGGLAATTGVELKYAGSIGGAYTLTINGGGQSGQVTLSGSNAYSATVIATGTLQIGDGDVSGTLGTAAVTNNGTLVFKRTDAIAVTQMISGTGAVNLIGTDSGSLILSSGANTYSGNTRIISGVLLAGASTTGSIASGPFGTGSVTVSDGATLDLNGQTIANPLNLNGTGISSLGALINTNVNVGTQTGNVVLQSLTSLGVGAEKSLALNTGVVSGNFALKINAGVGQTGMVLLSGSNTFNAGMTVYAGTVELGASSV
jgi:autotransporter-associated beta strand protein